MLKFRKSRNKSFCMRRIFICTIWVLVAYNLQGQKTSIYTDRTKDFDKGMELYDKGVYGSAYSAFESATLMKESESAPEVDLLSMKSKLMMGKSAVRMGKPDAEKVMLSYFRKNVPDALAYDAVLDLGNYYYNKRQYDEAISFYQMIDPSTLTDDQRSEFKFKEGYAQFVKKKFPEAKSSFNQIRNIQNDYFYPANYYYALSAYYTNDYKNAIDAFKRVQDSKKYKAIVPIHIAQIMLAQKKYDDLIAYAEPLMNDPEVRQQTEIRQMLGQAYFEMGQYDKAMPYLEEAATSGGAKREEDLFQLGVTQYKLKEYKKAISTLQSLADQNSEMGMYAMFYLADSYLKLGDKQAARNAFQKASTKKFDPQINEEALFNYAKLSVELGYDREAINTLQNINSSSPYYTEAQGLISDVLLNTRDYEKAIKILEGIPNKSASMLETYQQVLFYRGVQFHNQKGYDQAIKYFNKSLSTGTDRLLKTQAHMLIGDDLYQSGKINESKSELLQFIEMAKGLSGLPPQNSIAAAQYDLGYIYLGENNFKESLKQFEQSLTSFRKITASQDEYIATKIVPDLVLRIGDNYLKNNNYTKATQYFNEAIDKKYSNYVYALYQTAIIDGLQKDLNGKIRGLNNIADNYKTSDYADDALLELGNTYDAMDRPQDAINALKRLVNDHGSKSNLINKAYLKLGLVTYNQNDYNNALNYYKQVVKNNPTKEESDAAMTAIKEIYINDLKKPDEYFAYAETVPGYKASSSDKDDANFQVAEGYYEDGKYKEATEAYTTYLRKFDKGARSMEAYYKRGESYLALKDYKNALLDYEKVISFGNNAFYLDALEKAAVISYNYNNEFNAAYSYYKKWMDIETREDKKFEAQLGTLRSAYRINRREEVVQLADLVINNSRASLDQRSSAYFYKARSAQDIKNYDSALESYNFVIKNSNNVQTAESRYRIAQIYFLRKDLETAEELSQKSAEENNEFPYWVAKSLILLSDILADKGDYFNAKAALEAVLENFDDDKEISDEANQKLNELKKKDKSTNNIAPKKDEMEMDNGN